MSCKCLLQLKNQLQAQLQIPQFSHSGCLGVEYYACWCNMLHLQRVGVFMMKSFKVVVNLMSS